MYWNVFVLLFEYVIWLRRLSYVQLSVVVRLFCVTLVQLPLLSYAYDLPPAAVRWSWLSYE